VSAPVRTAAGMLSLLALAWIAWAAQAAEAPTLREGEHEGADFVVSVPEQWNGGLVMFAHGYEGEGPGRGGVHRSPLASHLTANGYAWAASGYRSRGYRPDWFLADTLALRERVVKEFGRPRWTIIHGLSMGGHVATASLELHPEVVPSGDDVLGDVTKLGLRWTTALHPSDPARRP
jgi:pimeloyl-ACP methyl ester carboxylesterase